jgi:anti-sigma-K factor RskA
MTEELENAAAEYALGTLPADERARIEERLGQDAALREAVRRWQSHLSPLDMTAVDTAPGPQVWRAIERAISSAPAAPIAPAGNLLVLRRRLAAWRAATAVTGALAAALAVFVLFDRFATPPTPEGGRYIAVVNSGGSEPALIAAVDTGTGIIRVRSLAAETPAGHSLELWHIAEGHEPRSLGVLQAGLDAQIIQDVATSGPVDGSIAVTVEPAGGSPSGAPTGPVVYSGRLIPVE